MKSQILVGIALMVAGVYTVEINEKRKPEPELVEVKVVTTEELIQQSSLNKLTHDIELRQDSVSKMIREKVEDDIVDSVLTPTEDSLIAPK